MNCFLWFEISENIWRWNRIICCKGFRCFSEIKLSYQIYQISPPPSPTWANIPQNCPSGDNFGKFFGGFDIVLKERGEGSNKVWFKCQDFTQSYPLGGFKVQSDKLCSKSSSFLRPKSPEGCNKSTPASVFTVLLRKKPCSLCFKYYNAIHPSNIVWDSKAFPEFHFKDWAIQFIFTILFDSPPFWNWLRRENTEVEVHLFQAVPSSKDLDIPWY